MKLTNPTKVYQLEKAYRTNKILKNRIATKTKTNPETVEKILNEYCKIVFTENR